MIFETQRDDECSTSKRTPRSGMSHTIDTKHKHVAMPLSPPSNYERTDPINGQNGMPMNRLKIAESKTDLLREMARFHSEEKGDEVEGRAITAKKWSIEHNESNTSILV